MTCSVDDCRKPSRQEGMCWMHVKRAQRLRNGKGKRGLNADPQEKTQSDMARAKNLLSRYVEIPTDESGDEQQRKLVELVRKLLSAVRNRKRRRKVSLTRQRLSARG